EGRAGAQVGGDRAALAAGGERGEGRGDLDGEAGGAVVDVHERVRARPVDARVVPELRLAGEDGDEEAEVPSERGEGAVPVQGAGGQGGGVGGGGPELEVEVGEGGAQGEGVGAVPADVVAGEEGGEETAHV